MPMVFKHLFILTAASPVRENGGRISANWKPESPGETGRPQRMVLRPDGVLLRLWIMPMHVVLFAVYAVSNGGPARRVLYDALLCARGSYSHADQDQNHGRNTGFYLQGLYCNRLLWSMCRVSDVT